MAELGMLRVFVYVVASGPPGVLLSAHATAQVRG
jgi:hypothetical protein